MTSYIADEINLIKLCSRNKNYNYFVNDKFIEAVILFKLYNRNSKLNRKHVSPLSSRLNYTKFSIYYF